MISSTNTPSHCWVCQRPHAKRRCPAQNAYICSLCCGSKRRKEINCPDDCQYLIAGKNHWIEKLEITPVQIDFWRTHFDIVHNIGFAILEIQRSRISDLKAAEVKQALENLIKTFETEERGIIYEYKSPNYRIQTIIDNIQNIISRHRNITPVQSLKPQPTNPVSDQPLRKVPLDEIIAGLKFIVGLIKQSISKTTRSNAYFDFITHFTASAVIESSN